MAQAVSLIPIEWTLDDYVADLVATSGCKRHEALSEMRERIEKKRLLFIRQRLVDGKPYDPWDRKPYDPEVVDTYDFECSYIFDFETVSGRVKVRNLTSRDSFEYCYIVAEPPRPPASQPAPEQQLEDKTGAADRSSAGQSPQKPLTTKDWLKGEVERRKKLGDIPEEITEFSRQLHSEMKEAVRAGVVTRVTVPRTIETHLRLTTNLFPKKKRSPES